MATTVTTTITAATFARNQNSKHFQLLVVILPATQCVPSVSSRPTLRPLVLVLDILIVIVVILQNINQCHELCVSFCNFCNMFAFSFYSSPSSTSCLPSSSPRVLFPLLILFFCSLAQKLQVIQYCKQADPPSGTSYKMPLRFVFFSFFSVSFPIIFFFFLLLLLFYSFFFVKERKLLKNKLKTE